MNGCNGSINHISLPSIRIFYCSSGTTAQRLAAKLEQRLHMILHLADKDQSIDRVAPLNDLDPDALIAGNLIIASCSGRGDVPTNGQLMLQKCKSFAKKLKASEVSYCIFGNGNSFYGANFNGSAIKLQSAMNNAGFSCAVPLFQADTFKEDPPWRQFEAWLAFLRATYGSVTDTTGNESAELADDAFELLLDQLSPAEVPSVHKPGGGDMQRVALDVGGLEYSHISHVDVFVPLSKDKVDDLLWTVRLTGKELILFEGKKFNTRHLFSIVDPDKLFKRASGGPASWG